MEDSSPLEQMLQTWAGANSHAYHELSHLALHRPLPNRYTDSAHPVGVRREQKAAL